MKRSLQKTDRHSQKVNRQRKSGSESPKRTEVKHSSRERKSDVKPDQKFKPNSTTFLGGVSSAKDVEQLVSLDSAMVAFCGRSNVGKSSLLNALCGVKVARVSASPGKTRELNFFNWAPTKMEKDSRVVVDLPGYGYAKVSKALREQWGKSITEWLLTERRLAVVVCLVDARHGFLAHDLDLLRMVQSLGVEYLVAFTKFDKWKSNNERAFAKRELQRISAELGVAEYRFVSSETKEGLPELRQWILLKSQVQRGGSLENQLDESTID